MSLNFSSQRFRSKLITTTILWQSQRCCLTMCLHRTAPRLCTITLLHTPHCNPTQELHGLHIIGANRSQMVLTKTRYDVATESIRFDLFLESFTSGGRTFLDSRTDCKLVEWNFKSCYDSYSW
jgi:hypothetical protein